MADEGRDQRRDRAESERKGCRGRSGMAFYPHGDFPCPSFIGSTYWIVNNEPAAWRGESSKSDPLSIPRHFSGPHGIQFARKRDSLPVGCAKALPGTKGRRKIMSFFERLKTAASAEWRAYTEHPFTEGLADGSLAEAAFRHYLVQDYLFLIEFARAYALSVYKSPKLADMREAAAGLSAILDIEMNLHVKLCAGWGLLPSDLEQAAPAVGTLAYTRYVLDAGMRGDLLALKVALAPCVIGYAEIATRLASRPDAHAATNPHRVWIAEYAGAPYQEVAATAQAHLEGLADRYATPARDADGLDDLGGGVADDVAADNAIGRAIHDQLHQDAGIAA